MNRCKNTSCTTHFLKFATPFCAPMRCTSGADRGSFKSKGSSADSGGAWRSKGKVVTMSNLTSAAVQLLARRHVVSVTRRSRIPHNTCTRKLYVPKSWLRLASQRRSSTVLNLSRRMSTSDSCLNFRSHAKCGCRLPERVVSIRLRLKSWRMIAGSCLITLEHTRLHCHLKADPIDPFAERRKGVLQFAESMAAAKE